MKNITIRWEKSKGSYVDDQFTNTYCLDLLNHYSSLPLGYNHPIFKTKGFLNEVQTVVAHKISMPVYKCSEFESFMQEFIPFAMRQFSYTHFTCTGSLAVEVAIKAAWYHTGLKNILTFDESFHGLNGLGNFTTSREPYLNDRLDGVPNADWNIKMPVDINALDFLTLLNKHYPAAVLIEPIQCTAGDIYIKPETLQMIAEACRQMKVPLIFDEIQTGFGSTGKVWYFEHLGIHPDMVVFGKKAQVSGVIMGAKYAKIFEHLEKLNVTFNGDLLDMIRCKYIIRAIEQEKLLHNIATMGSVFVERLKQIPYLQNVRGIGSLVAFDLNDTESRDLFCDTLRKNSVISNPTASNSVRLRLPLNIKTAHIDFAISAIEKSILQLKTTSPLT
ncbi:MAG: aminotransferase class III-fold pyridoxal phosphate-dependent enzyme [Flavobacteriaceae bacterium]|nr:aminotransferase class III-fold pyridoxal phosphate-dependent enzyme [Flavobacteriaceae bacterium]